MIRVRVTLHGKTDRELDVDREMTVGRKAPADVVLSDTQVSSLHAKLRPEGDGLVVTDLGSTNGTRVDEGERLAPNVPTPVRPGQKLVLGNSVFEIVAGDPAAQPDSGFGKVEKTVLVGAGAMQSLLVELAKFKAAQAKLVLGAEHARRTIDVREMEVVIGRDETGGAQVVVPHQSVSSKHARLRFAEGRFVLEDLGSSNGTFVNGVRIAGPTAIEAQTAVTFGTVDCLFAAKAPEAGGAEGAADPHAEVLTQHAVRMGKATEQQAREALQEHRTTGRTLGEIFVEKGVFGPREWAEVYRNRQMIATLRPAQTPGRKRSPAMVFGIVVVGLGLAVLAVFLWLRGGGR